MHIGVRGVRAMHREQRAYMRLSASRSGAAGWMAMVVRRYDMCVERFTSVWCNVNTDLFTVPVKKANSEAGRIETLDPS